MPVAGTENILLLVLLAAAFYVLILRPLRTRARALREEVRSSLAVGADVLTTAGMYARVAAVDDEDGTVLLEIAPGVTARYLKAAVGRVVTPAPTAAAGGATPAFGTESLGQEAGDSDADGGPAPTSRPPS